MDSTNSYSNPLSMAVRLAPLLSLPCSPFFTETHAIQMNLFNSLKEIFDLQFYHKKFRDKSN